MNDGEADEEVMSYDNLRKTIQTIRDNWKTVKTHVQSLDRKALHYSIRKAVAAVNNDEKQFFGEKGLPLTCFANVVKCINVDESAFDPYIARNDFLSALKQLCGINKKNPDLNFDRFYSREKDTFVQLLKETQHVEGNDFEESKTPDDVSVAVLLSFSLVLQCVELCFVDNSDVPMSQENVNTAALFYSPPPFVASGTLTGPNTGRKYAAAARLVDQITSSNDPSLQASYEAYMFSPHVAYLLVNRKHPLLYEDVASAACCTTIQNDSGELLRGQEGSIAEAILLQHDLAPRWESNVAQSRLISILDAPCTTKDCKFHSLIMALGEKAKAQGNGAFKEGKLDVALEYYGRAVGIVHWDWFNKAVYLSNAAQCLIKLERYGAAIRAAKASVEINPDNFKAWQRKSMAEEKVGNVPAAIRDAQRALSTTQGGKLGDAAIHDFEDRIRKLRSLISGGDSSLARFSRLGHNSDQLVIDEGRSLFHALVQQLNGTTRTSIESDLEQRETLSIDLATALKTYSTVLTRRAFPEMENDDQVYYGSPVALSAFQYEATVAILDNLLSVLLLIPDDTEARQLRARLCYRVGELDIVQNDILTLDDRSMGGNKAIREIRRHLDGKVKGILQDLEQTPYCRTKLIDTPDAPRIHGGNYRHKLRTKKLRKRIQQATEPDTAIFRDEKQMQEELFEISMVAIFRDCFWSSKNDLHTLREKWSALGEEERRCVTVLDDLDAIVERLPAFGDSKFDLRGPYAASQARVDRESLLNSQFMHESWARAMDGEETSSFGCAVARSTSLEIVPRFAPKNACIPLSEASIFGPALSCGLESFAVNDSACAPWRLEMRRKSCSVWADTSFQVVEADSDLGIASVSVMVLCCECNQYKRICAFSRLALKKIHDGSGQLACRVCQSGTRQFRGMAHLSRSDLHEKALLSSMKKFYSRYSDTPNAVNEMHENNIFMSRLDWMTAALDLFEDRVMGVQSIPSSAGSKFSNRTANVLVSKEGEEEASFENDDGDDYAEDIDSLSSMAMGLMVSAWSSTSHLLEDIGKFDKNETTCANCGCKDAPEYCQGCHCLCFCSSRCHSEKWKASHKNCCMSAKSVSDIFGRLLASEPKEGKVLAHIIASPLAESEKQRRKLLKLHPEAGKKLSIVLKRTKLISSNAGYLNNLSTILLTICSHTAGRRGMGEVGLMNINSALMACDPLSDFPHSVKLMKAITCFI